VRGGLCSEKNIATADTLITLSTLMIILKSERMMETTSKSMVKM
jgi:hypothetical protein